MIHAIETQHNGFRFRSLTEARWAVFFETLGVPYRYEMEGYDLGDGIWYLPDFWLPEQDCWVEIKGAAPTREEEEKAARLAMATGKTVYIFHGDCWMPEFGDEPSVVMYPDSWNDDDKRISGCDYGHFWCECIHCGSVGIEYNGRAARLPCGCYKKIDPECDKAYNHDSLRLYQAYTRARQFRPGGRRRRRRHGTGEGAVA